MTAEKPTPSPRHAAAEREVCKIEGCTKTGEDQGGLIRGLCPGHWASRRGDADPKEAPTP